MTYELAYLAHLSLHPCKPGSRKDAVPMVLGNVVIPLAVYRIGGAG